MLYIGVGIACAMISAFMLCQKGQNLSSFMPSLVIAVFLWPIFIVLCLLTIFGDPLDVNRSFIQRSKVRRAIRCIDKFQRGEPLWDHEYDFMETHVGANWRERIENATKIGEEVKLIASRL